jgi:DnaJ-class molecular chaperone
MLDEEYYFNILNIDKTHDLSIITRAYRRLSLKLYSENNNNNFEFNKLNDAYKYLLDYLKINTKLSNTIISNNNNNNNNNNNIFEPNKIISQNINSENYIIHKNVKITFKQSYTGCNIPINIEKTINNNNIIHYEIETIYIKIYNGIDNNEIIIIKNKGNIIDNITYDIKVLVTLIEDVNFKRIGLDLIFNKTISLKESLTGNDFEIEHLNGKQYKIKNTKLIKHNYNEIISNLGFLRDEYTGNLIIIYNVSYPRSLTTSVIDTLKQIL